MRHAEHWRCCGPAVGEPQARHPQWLMRSLPTVCDVVTRIRVPLMLSESPGCYSPCHSLLHHPPPASYAKLSIPLQSIEPWIFYFPQQCAGYPDFSSVSDFQNHFWGTMVEKLLFHNFDNITQLLQRYKNMQEKSVISLPSPLATTR